MKRCSVVLAGVMCATAMLSAQDKAVRFQGHEAAQWRYVSEQLAAAIQKSEGFSNKAGRVMKEYAIPIAFAGEVAAIVTLFTRLVVLYQRFPGTPEQRVQLLAGALASDGVASKCLCVMAAYFYLWPLFIAGVRAAGGLLEDRDVVSKKALVDFINQWEAHKTKTPAALQPLFDGLKADFEKNKKITYIKPAELEKLLQELVSSAHQLGQIA